MLGLRDGSIESFPDRISGQLLSESRAKFHRDRMIVVAASSQLPHLRHERCAIDSLAESAAGWPYREG